MKDDFKNAEDARIYHNFKEISCLAFYQPQNENSIHRFISSAQGKGFQSVEVTVDLNDDKTLKFVKTNGI